MTLSLARWHSALPSDTDPVAAGQAGQVLLRCWSQPHRRHHTGEHLTAVLDVVDAHAGLAADPDAVRLAAWFHDAVYDPEAADNEERSATFACGLLWQLGVASERVKEVARLVRLTATHQPAPGDVDGGLLVDADLGILAATPERYDLYTRHIREEHRHVSDEEFARGRIAVLSGLLDQGTLYRVVRGRDAMTVAALANLLRERESLELPG